MNGDSNALSILIERYKDKIYTSIYLLVKTNISQKIFSRMSLSVLSTRFAAAVILMKENSCPGPCVSLTIFAWIISVK